VEGAGEVGHFIAGVVWRAGDKKDEEEPAAARRFL